MSKEIITTPYGTFRTEELPSPRTNFEAWHEALMATGQITQDEEEGVDLDQADRDCRRYASLVDLATGEEGDLVLRALFDSMQAAEDYEVYEANFRVFHRFPQRLLGAVGFGCLSGLLERSHFRAWDFLNHLAMDSYGEALNAFNEEWASAPAEWREQLLDMVIQDEEDEGWLMGKRRGRLRPAEPLG